MFAGFSPCVTQAKSWVSSFGFVPSLGAPLVFGVTMSNEKEQPAPHPIYGKKPSLPGLYLGLFHGRHGPREEMEDWGFDGPMIGPLKWFHTTYACTLRIAFERGEDAMRYFGTHQTEQFLTLDGDLLVFEGKYYGDWTAYKVDPEDCDRPKDNFRNDQRLDRLRSNSSCIG
jgi:hypothetical protein